MIWVVVPTYNEIENLEPILIKIFRNPGVTVLIVDDNSPDGTGDRAESFRSRWPQLSVLHRQKKTGLSDAYRDGLQYALSHGAEIVLHMDADGSHDPTHIPDMIAALAQADMVVGSRYVHGGALVIPIYRKWISLVGNWYMRLLLGRELHDWSSGFKAWRAPMLQQVLNQPWPSRGYACLIVMSWIAKQHQARFAEVAIRFVDRTRGQSKFSLGIMLEDLRLAWKLRTQRLARTPKS